MLQAKSLVLMAPGGSVYNKKSTNPSAAVSKWFEYIWLLIENINTSSEKEKFNLSLAFSQKDPRYLYHRGILF